MRAGRYCILICGECSFRRPKTMALSRSISTLIEKTYWAVFANAFHTTDITSSSIVVSLFIPYFWYSRVGVVVVQIWRCCLRHITIVYYGRSMPIKPKHYIHSIVKNNDRPYVTTTRLHPELLHPELVPLIRSPFRHSGVPLGLAQK